MMWKARSIATLLLFWLEHLDGKGSKIPGLGMGSGNRA